ncbi:hypothetical protein BTVI_63582 [Pitangus sulphuratus]|nr:hypothetical protein BTVI_63582 [Pitangus sulphuratus]
MDLLQMIQRKAMKKIRGMEYHSYKERLRELELLNLEKRKLQRDLIAAFWYLKNDIELLESSSEYSLLKPKSIRFLKTQPDSLVQIRNLLCINRSWRSYFDSSYYKNDVIRDIDTTSTDAKLSLVLALILHFIFDTQSMRLMDSRARLGMGMKDHYSHKLTGEMRKR